MIDLSIEDAPRHIAQIARQAIALGWSVRVTVADGPPSTICLRVARGDVRAYGTWRTHKAPSWWGGATNGMRPLKTLTAFRSVVGL